MKKNFMFVGIAALMLAGCSSDDLVKDEVKGGEGNSFVGLSISLPTNAGGANHAPMQRAVNYDDGISKEYEVKDVTLVFATSTGVIKQVTKFTDADLNWNKEGSNTDEITSSSVLPVVPMYDNSAEKVLVLVNSSDVFTVVGSTKDGQGNKTLTPGSIKKGSTDITSFTELKKAIESTDISKFTTNGFFMASAALGTSTADDRLEVTVVKSESKEGAMSDANTGKNVIYVERAAAKVALEFTGGSTMTPSGAAFNSDKIVFDGWVLDNVNTSTFPFRTVATTSPNWADYGGRFCPTVTGSVPQRYEFSVDPNFYSSGTGGPSVAPGITFVYYGTDAVTNSVSSPLYCLENTFNMANMKQSQTTRVVLRGTYTPSGFGDVSTDGWYRLGESTNAYTKTTMLDAISTAASAVGVTGFTSVKVVNPKVGKNPLEKTGGSANVLQLLDASSNPISYTDEQFAGIKGIVGDLTYYENGYCYYPVLIRHFSDTEPFDPNEGVQKWNNDDYLTASDDAENNKKWLGRYGVVRNNSYVLTINSVSAPGTPVMPAITEDMDDVQNYYIQATIKILSWSKRSQSVDL